MALEMNRRCETCEVPLVLDGDTRICSYECTCCSACAAAHDHIRADRDGPLEIQPRRSPEG